MTDHDPRKHLNQLMKWARNYQSSRVLTTAVRKELLERFQDGPRTLDEAIRPEENPEALRLFLNALTSMDLLRYRGDEIGYEATTLTHEYLLPDSPYDLRPILALFHDSYEMWTRLPEILEEGHGIEEKTPGDLEFDRDFMLAMETRAHFAKQDVAEVVSDLLEDGDRLVDLGGGTGVFTREILKQAPGTSAVIADMEHVGETAREFLVDSPVSNRIQFRPLDFFEDESYGENFDMALLFSVCHIFNSEENHTILERTARALNPDGTLVIRDFVLDNDGAGALEGNLFGLHMFLATDSGRVYTLDEFRQILADAGLVFEKQISMEGGDDLLVAKKPVN